MKPIRTIVILLAALVLAASCINPRPAPAPQDTSSHDITAEQFTYNGHQWIAFFYHFDTRQLFEARHDPDCPCHGGAAGKREEREDTPAFQVIPAYQPYNTSKQ